MQINEIKLQQNFELESREDAKGMENKFVCTSIKSLACTTTSHTVVTDTKVICHTWLQQRGRRGLFLLSEVRGFNL